MGDVVPMMFSDALDIVDKVRANDLEGVTYEQLCQALLILDEVLEDSGDCNDCNDDDYHFIDEGDDIFDDYN